MAERRAVERGQAEHILPLLVDAVLADAGWSWAELDLLAVTVGPGSFTGIRTGVALARALALALGLTGLGVGTLETLAEAAGPRAVCWRSSDLRARRRRGRTRSASTAAELPPPSRGSSRPRT